MDLYQLDPLRKSFSERTSRFQRTDVASSVPHHGDLSKFPNSDLLSSSAWSSVIHQPDQDSDPEDLPSTVDIDAIKEPPTPVNASAQTPAGQLHGDSHTFELSDEQNAGESGSDSDSDSESGNSENENAASGADSGTCSDSDSVSSHPSSSSSKDKPASSRSSRSNSPPSAHNNQQQQFAVRETNFEQGGLRLKFSALKRPKQKYDNDNAEFSSDSSDTKVKFDNRPKNKRMFSLKARNDSKNKSAFFCKDQLKRSNLNEKDFDSDSSSSCNISPEKQPNACSTKARISMKSNTKLETIVNRPKSVVMDKPSPGVGKDKNERILNHSTNKRNDLNKSTLSSSKDSAQFGTMHSKYRGLSKQSFGPPSLKLPQTCKLSEDSDESLESSKTVLKNSNKKENDRDTIEKLAQQLTQPGDTTDQLQVLNEEDLAAVLPDVEGNASGVNEFEFTDGNGTRKRNQPITENKKVVSSDSSSEAEMFPKQKQIVTDVINSIHIDSDSSNDSADSDDDSSSNDEHEKEKWNNKSQYLSNLSISRAKQTTRLEKINTKNTLKSKPSVTAASINKNTDNAVVKKRGRPPKIKNSTTADIETYMRLDCTVSNVSPDSGIQSSAGSPLYHNLYSSTTIHNQIPRSIGRKLASVPSKSLNLTQKAVLSASKKKNIHQRSGEVSKNIKEILTTREPAKVASSSLLKNKVEVEKKSALGLKQTARFKTVNETNKPSSYLDSKISQSASNVDSLHSDLTLFQGKRGPGRPKKAVSAKVNGKTKSEKLPMELDGPYEKANYHAQKPSVISSVGYKTNPKKLKYCGPVVMNLDNKKKHKKKNANVVPVVCQSLKPISSQKTPVFPVRKEWLRKHKKRKKKDSKEKSINTEVLKLIDDLIETFDKKCVIGERKVPKLTHRLKEKSKKKKNTEKTKHSDNEYECESVPSVSAAMNIASSKRRHKKSAIETPKVLHTSEQRLPLKKRHYHVSSSSITSNGHQNNGESKIRTDKHLLPHSNEPSSPLPIAIENIAKINENVKSKVDGPKPSSKSDAQKAVSKSEPIKSTTKPESGKTSGKIELQKPFSKDTTKNSPKNEPPKSSNKVDSRKIPAKVAYQHTTKMESNKSSKLDSTKEESDIVVISDNVEKDVAPLVPVKKPRIDEEKKISRRNSVTKELLPFLPLRRSGRSITKKEESSPDRKSKSDTKTNSVKSKNDVEVESNSDPVHKRNSKRNDVAAKIDPAPVAVSTVPANGIISKKEKLGPSKSSSDTNSSSSLKNKELVSENTSTVGNVVGATNTHTKHQINNKPQLITPLPSEPVQQNTSTVALKPPAGVFEPSKKLPSSVSKPKKSSIDDVLSKLKEKLKDLNSPSKNTSALIEKIGVSKNDIVEVSNNDRVLRSKRPSTESDTLNAKKSKICKDMSIRLRKLTNSEIINSGVTTSELKPKLKRRKTINRTGFPVKKKKKRSRIDIDSISGGNANEEFCISSVTEQKKTDAIEETSITDICSVEIVKNELIEEQGHKNQSIESHPHSTNSAVKVKSEVMSEDEIIPVPDLRLPMKNSKKKRAPVKQDVPSRVLPSRCSARIYIKQQIRAREMKKSKKKSAKKTKLKKGAKSKSVENNQKPVAAKLLEPRKCKLKDIREKVNLRNDSDKDSKSREGTDREEFSDTDSVKYQNAKKVDIPKWKKKYFTAGLFSNFYKQEKQNAVDTKSRSNFKEEDHPHGLLPSPSYCDDYVRGRRVDFKLPFDLWWLHSHNQLPGRDDVVHSWNYKKIRTNVYYDVKPTYMYEAQACNCKIPTEKDELGCGDDCINRLVYAECSPDLCPLKQKCSNQKIQKHEWAPKLMKFMTKDKGWGVKTNESIKNGNFVLEYVGEVVTDKEFKKRMTSLYKNDIHHYCLNLDGGLLIDGHRMGGFGRFVNHSCEPNCEMQKWSVNGLFRMVLFALRDIEAGEELTYDYNFALFNPAEGQPCLCGSANCRGVIGGKSQRVPLNNVNNPSTSETTNSSATNAASNADKKSNRLRPRKQIRKNTIIENSHSQRRDSVASSNSVGILPQRNTYNLTPVKPLTSDEKKTVLNFRVFLIRNLIKIQHFREKFIQLYNNKENSNSLNQNCVENAAAKESAVFVTHFNALSTQRGITTRRLAQAQDNPEVTKIAQLAKVFRTIFNDVICAKDEKGEPFSSLFMTLPSKRKLPMYYQRISDPIDLTTIEKNIVTGMYKNVELFDKDMKKLIANSVKYYKRTSDYGIAAVRLRKEFNISKLKHVEELKKIAGETLPPSFMPGQEDPGDEEEDVIRCICGFYRDEGVMIQCERCLVWQHCDCVKGDPSAEHYLCERCDPREVDFEIPLDTVPEYAEPGEKHYLTLMRDDLQIKQGDTVYVLREIENPETKTRHTFRTIKNFKFEDCDIFRVERLYINEKGVRMSFGHHYLRPHETYHEPTRRFFTNEVIQVPIYEKIPLDLIMGQCYVLSLSTYRKGRPIDSDTQHIYICEFRVDRKARLFYKLRQSKQPKVCTKSYAFDTYDTPLKPFRTYAPHGEVKPSSGTSTTSNASKIQLTHPKVRVPKVDKVEEADSDNRLMFDSTAENSCSSTKMDEDDLPLSHLKDSKSDKSEKQKQRLNSILLKLLAKKSSTKAPLDASYLLDLGRRNRKKPELFST